MEFSDGEILIRPFVISDAQDHLKGEDDELVKWISGGISNIEGIENWIKKNKESWVNNGPVFNFAIVNVKDNQLLGMIEANVNFSKFKGLREGDVNISYGLYPLARGKGYASKAIQLISKFLKEKKYSRLIIRVSPDNHKSIALALRNNFLKQNTIIDPNEGEMIIYSKTIN